MAKKKSGATKKKYRVKVDSVHNNDTGAAFVKGDIVTSDDFPQETLNNWLIIEPPALEIV